MKRLTTDQPEGNVENLLNLFYIKDQWTWVRGGGPAPDYKDVSLCDLVRMMVKANILDTELPKDDDNLSMMMHEWLMDETDTAEGIIALLYNAGWAFAELRHRLAHYEDLEEQGRLVELPFSQGKCLVDSSNLERPEFLKNFRVAIAYDHCGIVFHQPLGIFMENLRRGYITECRLPLEQVQGGAE